MNLVVLAWRNVLRQKRRTATSLSALVVGLSGLVVFQGYLGQTIVGFRNQTVQAGIGHLQVSSAPAYFTEGEFSPSAYALTDQDQLQKRLGDDPRVEAAFPSTGFTAIAGSQEKSVTLLIKAYPADKMVFEGAAGPGQFRLGPLVAGRWEAGVGDHRLVLGETSARILKVSVGSEVTIMILLPNGGLDARDFTVSAIYRNPGRDKIFAYTDYESAQNLLGMDKAPVLHVLLKDVNTTAAVAATYEKGRRVKTYNELAPFYVQVRDMFGGFLAVIRTILLLITLFILANTMNRIVLERMREWGTLRALGTKARQILGLVVLEGAFQGLVGASLGLLLGLTLSLVINVFGGIPYVNGDEVHPIRVLPDQDLLWWNLIPVVLTAGASAFVPALRAIRLQPAEALRSL